MKKKNFTSTSEEPETMSPVKENLLFCDTPSIEKKKKMLSAAVSSSQLARVFLRMNIKSGLSVATVLRLHTVLST